MQNLPDFFAQYGSIILFGVAVIGAFLIGHASKKATPTEPAQPITQKQEPIAIVAPKIVEPAKLAADKEDSKSVVTVVTTKPEPSPDIGDVRTLSSADTQKTTDKVAAAPTKSEVAKAHDALDAAKVYGEDRLKVIAGVRQGAFNADDVARAHPPVAKDAAVEVAKPAEGAPAQS